MSGADDAYCADCARAHDRDRYLAAQFAAPPARARLLALLALDAEIARVARAVREPLLAEMRLQWWLDGIAAVLAGKPAPKQPALEAFAGAIRDSFGGSGLAADRLGPPFARLIVARNRDFADRPLRGADDARTHAEALSAVVVDAALALLGVADGTVRDPARAAGLAYVLVGLPGAGREPIAGLIREHIARAREAAARIPRAALPVMLWATAAEIRTRRLAQGRAPGSPWLPLALAWRAWRGRY